jgi:hypothetical protein
VKFQQHAEKLENKAKNQEEKELKELPKILRNDFKKFDKLD